MMVESGDVAESGDTVDRDGVRWVAPESEAELMECIREAGYGSGRVRVATGGGALPGGDAEPPGRRDIRMVTGPEAAGIDVISLEAPSFARIIEYEPKDLTITVGAGTRLDALQGTLATEGQWLPPAALGAAGSVGGFVGTAAPGPLDAAFGSVRRHVLAVRTVAWDGRPLTWGRAVVKNVAGYDLRGLWCGSRGRLGVVTGASLRVWPQPEHREWLEVRGSRDGWRLLESLGEIEPQAKFRPDGLLWKGSREGDGAHVLVGLLGSLPSVRSRGALAREWADRHGHEIAERRIGKQGEGKMSPDSFALFEPRSRSLAQVTIRVRCPRSMLAKVGRGLTRALGEVPVALDALPELGILRASYTRPEDPARAARLRTELFQAAGSAAITLEVAGPEELAAAEGRRETEVRNLEQTVLAALGGTARHWLSDHV